MGNNVIFEALAFLEGYSPSPSMKGMSNSAKIHEIYIKNAILSLVSIKQHNPNTDVGIVVNFKLDEKWKRELETGGIILWECAFDYFHMPQSIVYSLSYYKLCAFRYIIDNTEYMNFCFIDCDTFAVRDFAPIWKECEDAFMIVPGDEGMDNPVRREISKIYKKMKGKRKNITHYCSSFIISSRADAVKVIKKCEEIYKGLWEIGARPAGGDEVIWSLALADMDVHIYSPKVYCLLSNIGFKKYWVDKADYHDEHIIMWHLPTEKRYALIWAYNYYLKNKKLPNVDKMSKACRIRVIRNKFNPLAVKAIFQDPTVMKRNLWKIFKR